MDGLSAIQRELNPRWCLAYDTIHRHDIDRLIQWLRTYPRLTKGAVTRDFESREKVMVSSVGLVTAIEQVIQRVLSSNPWCFETPTGGNSDKRDELVSNDRIFSDGFQPDWTSEQDLRELANRVGAP